MKANGFVLIGCLALIPVLVSILLGFSLWSHVLQETGESLHFCRDTLLKAQKDLLLAMVEVIKLNPKARALRMERKNAELQLKIAIASVNPEAISAAQTQLQSVMAKQMIFRSHQRMLFSNYRLRLQLTKEGVRQRWLQKFHSSSPKLSLRSPQINLVESPFGNLSPDYLPDENFEEKQVFQLNWKHTHPLLSQISDRKLQLWSADSKCSTTIYRSQKLWKTSLLSADRF